MDCLSNQAGLSTSIRRVCSERVARNPLDAIRHFSGVERDPADAGDPERNDGGIGD
jgi:hypothetical protein